MSKYPIHTLGARDRLAPRREPYWHSLGTGRQLGFRRMNADSPGQWLVRAWDATAGRYASHTLGTLDDKKQGERFDEAMRQAQAWLAHVEKGGATKPHTVKEACERYEAHVRATRGNKAAADPAGRFRRWVLSDATFSALPVAKLQPQHLDRWLQTMRARDVSAAGLNRDKTALRAALNLALNDGLVTSDFAWRAKLKPAKNADGRRTLYLDRAQRQALIDAAPADLAALLRGLCAVPLRPGALAALRVADFDAKLSTLRVVQGDKGHSARTVKLPPTTAKFFASAAAGKLPAAPLLARADGSAWNKDAWKWPMKAAVEAAGLPPETIAYTLRHSVITDMVHKGVDLLTVAQLSGTSVRMIEQHYGHLREHVAEAALAEIAL